METGLRFCLWRIESGAVRPLVGAAYAQSDFEQMTSLGTGVDEQKSRIPLQAGLTWQRGSTLVEVGVGRFPGNQFDYFVDPSRATTVRLPSTYMWVGVNRQFDSTIGLSRDWEGGRTSEMMRRAADAGALSGFSLAIGPAAAFL